MKLGIGPKNVVKGLIQIRLLMEKQGRDPDSLCRAARLKKPFKSVDNGGLFGARSADCRGDYRYFCDKPQFSATSRRGSLLFRHVTRGRLRWRAPASSAEHRRQLLFLVARRNLKRIGGQSLRTNPG